jgi:hypothetical protein
MTTKSQIEQLVRYSRRHKRACPKCGGDLFRIARRSIDRAISAFMPVQRFRCHFFSCHWEGNIRLTRQESAAIEAEADSTNALGTRASGQSPSRKVPRSFLVHMCLTVAGLVAVVVFTTTDLFSDPEVGIAERRSQQWVTNPKLADQGTRISRPSQASPR